MAKLSQTFKIEGGSNTAPVSTYQPQKLSQSFRIEGDNSAPVSYGSGKLSQTFTIGQKSVLPDLQQGKPVTPIPNYDTNVIKEYESLPKTDIFSRLFSKESRDAYKRKQELNPLYEQNKDLQTKQLLSNLGISDNDIMRQSGNTRAEEKRITSLLSSKGITDKDTIDAIKGYSERLLNQKADKNLTEYADEHPVKGSALSIPFRMVAGVAGQAENAANYLSGNPLSNSQGALAFNNSVNNMRGAVADDMNGVGRFLYNSGMSMGDMLANRWMLGPLAPVGMGMEKATDTTNSAVNQGLTPNQIMLKNISSGVTTYLTEKYLTMPKLDAIKEMGFSALGKEGGKQIVLRALNAAGLAEGAQEGAEDVADWIADALIARGKNEFKQAYDAYKEQGLSDGKAVASVIGDKATELVMDMAGGYLSGFAGGGAEMTKAGVANNINNRNTNIPTLEQTSEATTPVEQPTSVSNAPVEEQQTNTPIEAKAPAQEPVAVQAPTKYDTQNVTDKKLNRILNDHFKMFAFNDEGTALKDQLKQAINEYENTLSPDALNRINVLVQTSEEMMKNGNYEWKRDSGKRSGKVRHTTYPNYRGTVTDNVMQYVNRVQGMDNLVNKTNEAYRTEINNLAETLNTANADETAWDYLNEIKENLDQFVETGDEDVLENAVNAVGDMVSAAGINYSNVQKDFEQALNNAVEANKRNSENKVMAEDIGLNKKSKAKQIPSVDNNESTIEVPIEDLEDRRNGATYVGRTASNTFRNAEMFNPETGEKIYETRKLIEDQIKNGNADVERQTWLASNKEGVKNLQENGFEKEKQRILESGTETTQTQIAESVYIMDNEINKALKSGDTTQLGIFVNRLVQRMHKVGQALQALRMYGNTASGMALATDSLAGAEVKAFVNDAAKNPNGKKAKALKQNAKLAEALKQLGYDGTMEKEVAPKTFEQYKQEVQNTLSRESSSIQERFSDTDIEYLARLLEHGATTEDIKNALDRHLATGYFGISAEDLQAITDLYNRADRSKSSKETAELRKQAAAIASKYLGKPTLMDKWNAWRYLSMLGNPRTMIRNILGNTTFGAVTDIKDAVGAVLESAFIKDGERTKAILTKADSNLIKACADYFDKKAYEQATEGGHKFNMKHEVEGERQIFKSKLLEGARKLTDKVLEESDNFALKRKYSKALAGYLKANGYDASVLKTDNSILERANEYAIAQAKEATFHADNSVADMLNDWSRSARERGGLGGKIGEVLIESTMPFKKTPANILKQGFEYSPLSLLKLASQVRSRAGANAYIDTISKGLTGSGILALGAWLASRGLLVGKRDDDDDPYKKGSDYALKIGGKSYSLDWTAPAAMPLFVGVELYNHFNPNESADEAKGFFESLASIGEPAIEMSMLEGLSNTLDAISNAKNNKASATAANIISGYVTQAIPTLSGQIARTIDPYRRSTRTNASTSSNAITATLEKSAEKVMNKIPGLSMLNQKYIDVWGNPQKNSGGNLLGRAFQNFVSPGYLNDVSLTDREKKLADLQKTYEGSGSLIPTLAKSNKPDGSRMSNTEYERYSKARGQELQKAVDAALKYKGKSGVKTEVLQDCVHDIENFANYVTEHKQFGKKISDTYKKAYEAYELGGYDGVMLYYLMNKNADLDGNGSITQEELAKYLRSSDIPRKQREDYFKIKFPKAKEIPTLR